MNTRYTLLIVLLLLLIHLQIAGQQSAIDSLKHYISKSDVSDAEKIPLLGSLAIYNFTTDKEESFEYAKQATSLASRQKDKKYGVQAYACIAVMYANTDSLVQAYIMSDSCLWYIDKCDNPDIKAYGLNSLVIIKNHMGEKDSIPNMLQKALDLIDGRSNWDMEGRISFGLYDYYIGNNPQYAKKYIDRSYNASMKVNKPIPVMRSYYGKAKCFIKLYEEEHSKILLDSALYYNRKAAELVQSKGDYIADDNKMEMLSNFVEIFIHREVKDSVSYYGKQLIKLAIEMDDDIYLSNTYKMLSNWEISNRNFDKAKRYIEEALALMEKKQGYPDIKYELSQNLSSIYEQTGKYELALEYSKKAFDYFKIDNQEKHIREAQVAEAKYKIGEKIKQLEKAKHLNQKYIAFSIIIFLIMLAIGLFSWNNYLKLKNSKQKKMILEKEKEDALLQALLEEEKTKRLAAEKANLEVALADLKNRAIIKSIEIRQLRKGLIAENIHLEHKNEIISNIKSIINEKPNISGKDLSNTFSLDKKINTTFEEFSELVQKVHPHFYTELQNKAQQKLTPLDLKYCTYIFMNVDTKDIAALLFVEPKTVRMSKYRLKQKLNLDKDKDLHAFIHQMVNSEGL